MFSEVQLKAFEQFQCGWCELEQLKGFNTFFHNVEKWLNILSICSHRKIVKLCLTIFQYFERKDYIKDDLT